MDTIETTSAPVGAEGATSSQDTAPQTDTQTVETPNAVSAPEGEETGTQSEEPLLAGKYKSPQELEKAYKELEKMQGTLGQKAAVADLIEKKYGVSPQQMRELIDRQEQERMQREYEANPGAFAYQEVQQLKAQLALQEETAKLDAFVRENPEYAPFRDDIQDFAFLPKYQDMSYEDIAKEKFGKAIAQGQQSAYKKIETKKMSQNTSVTSIPPRQIGADDLKNMSVSELEDILPHA